MEQKDIPMYREPLFPTSAMVVWDKDHRAAHITIFYEDGDVAQEGRVCANEAHYFIASVPLEISQAEAL